LDSFQNSRDEQIISCLRTLQESIDRLRDLLGTPTNEIAEKFYRRRRDLLTRIFASEGLNQSTLFRLLDEHKTPHQWIGQQVKSGFLEKLPRPNGQELYVATNKAVIELELRAEAESLSTLTDETLGADWESPEDGAYDRL